jgi:hypothetical protein
MLKSRLISLADCGLPSFTFAGFAWPRYVGTLPRGSLANRFKNRHSRGLTGDYYHAPAPDAAKGRGFYLESDGMPRLRWQWADECEGARIRHSGWFCHDDGCGETIRGIVMRLPRGRGFLAGWSMGEGMASTIDYSPIFDNAADAAACADSMAENAADDEREYQAREWAKVEARELAELDVKEKTRELEQAIALRHRSKFGGFDRVRDAIAELREARETLAEFEGDE